eukprot:10507958-Heterocapsa_arctica.AAC.1
MSMRERAGKRALCVLMTSVRCRRRPSSRSSTSSSISMRRGVIGTRLHGHVRIYAKIAEHAVQPLQCADGDGKMDNWPWDCDETDDMES